MTDKEFRCLCRGDLIEIICDMQKKQLSLKQENENFPQRVNDKRLADVII